MDVMGNLDFKGVGKLKRAGLAASEFPLNPTVGEFAFVNKKVFICVMLTGDIPFWVPLTQEINTFRYQAPTPALEWTVKHDFGTNLALVQVYDVDGKQVIPDDIDCSKENTCTITFGAPTAGSAILMYGDELLGQAKSPVAYEQTFTNTATWVVSHNLGYNPAITCIINGYVVQPQSVVHDSLMQTTVTFSSAQTGTVRCV